MKRLLLVFSLLLFIGVIITSFRPEKNQSLSPAAEVKTQFLEDLHTFQIACERLHHSTSQLTEANLKEAQQAFINARYAYKTIEFLAAYLDEEFIGNNINGAPLLSLEPNAPQLSILEPEGFQILEETLFSENPLEEKEAIIAYTAALSRSAQELSYLRQTYLTDRQVIEAARMALIRVFTLGVTGFDSPVLANSLPEASQVLVSLQKAIQLYIPLVGVKNANLAQRLESTVAEAVDYLAKNQDFDTFDRLGFLKGYINPLYADLLDAQLALQIETYYETASPYHKHAINYFAKNIFDEDFLNPFYYTRMSSQSYTGAAVQLGRTLFFDPLLSNNNERSCASCHQPEKAFTDGLARSLATNSEGTVKRNAPTLLNAAYADRYFYDLRSEVLEDQMDHVVYDHREFQTSYLAVFEKIQRSEDYLAMFSEAFPEMKDDPVNKHTLTTALATYIVSLKSLSSPFDQYVRDEQESLDASVKRGFNLFMGKAACGTCHFAPTFNGLVPPIYHESESEVLGVPNTTDTATMVIDDDLGRALGVIKEYVDFYRHSFKTTTVRNVALTAPYMHNGVYETLEEVVDFYNQGGGEGMGLDVPYQTLPPDPLNLTDQEQADLVAFMESLTDTAQVNQVPRELPTFADNEDWNQRKVGGTY
ncbi:cytochrome c peroxidase [Tunicatimonas pelagia]|uniref:cytochrome c peroxidase n=1 Tax=Tunicatimonas pelagia TaxID=931531 RepID=UPI002666A3FB|nr:cytochrome c peroxidase [Tunicatimonas pelagia]WKN41338.1 cytochrome c peroxidase [Tunicatimonas pelagia]